MKLLCSLKLTKAGECLIESDSRERILVGES